MARTTNREVLIDLLQTDDFEYMKYATSKIECPYYSDSDCHNPYKYGTADFQIYCDETCKIEWLDSEMEDW